MIKVTAIVPAKLKNVFKDELVRILDDVGKGIEKDFQRTQSTWEHKAAFDQENHTSGSPMMTEVYTTDEIYGYVSEGTRAHVISPVSARVLAFPGVYTAKTMPGVIDARGGGKSGATVFAGQVMHPGTAARKFDEAVAKEWKDKFVDKVEAGLERAAAKSGHGM